jgi:hypothetical protein
MLEALVPTLQKVNKITNKDIKHRLPGSQSLILLFPENICHPQE